MADALTSDFVSSFKVRKKYRHFRILVIGRANAGKTTLLKRVCNTTEEPRGFRDQNAGPDPGWLVAAGGSKKKNWTSSKFCLLKGF